MAEEVKHLYWVAWEDPKGPDKVSLIFRLLLGEIEASMKYVCR